MSDNSIGALWKGKDKIAFTGSITVKGEQIKIVIFENKYKEGIATRPDYKIYLSRPKEEKEQSGLEPF